MTELQTRERRPLAGAPSSNRSDATTPTVLAGTLDVPPDAMDWYESGVLHGIEIGRRQVVAEWHAVRADGGRVARLLAASPSYAELCERRGQPDRAAAQRRILAERGIAL